MKFVFPPVCAVLPIPLVGGALLPINGTLVAAGGLNSNLILELDLKKQAIKHTFISQNRKINNHVLF